MYLRYGKHEIRISYGAPLLTASVIAALWAASEPAAFAQGDKTEAPANAKVSIKGLKINGSGCPVDSTTELVTNDKPDEPFTYFQVTYDSFVVEIGPNPKHDFRKFCNIALALEYPVGWQYTIVELQTSGFAQIAEGAEGQFRSTYQFRGRRNMERLETKKLESGFIGDYEVTAQVTNENTVWSNCDSRIPLNIKSTIMLLGDESKKSMMSVDVQSGLLSQTYEVRWKKCQTEDKAL